MTTVDGRVVADARMTAMRHLFTAMFDAVDSSGAWTEDKWVHLIAVFNEAGRLVFGWPNLVSSESDIFGALDDIAMQLEGTKNAIEQTTKEARTVMHDLHEALGPDYPGADAIPVRADDPAPPAPDPLAAETEPFEDSPTNSPVPRAADLPERASILESAPGAPVTPTVEDETLFDIIRREPAISMAAAERAAGMQPSRGIQRMKLLDSYGTLPADIKNWRETRSKTRGVPKGTSSQRVREEINRTTQTVRATPVDPDESFDERRTRLARERANAEMDARRVSA